MKQQRSIGSRILLGLLSAGLLRGALWMLRGQRVGRRSAVSPLQREHPKVPDTGAYTPTRIGS